MISQEVFLEAEASYSTGLAGGFFYTKDHNKKTAPSGAENMVERRGFEPLTS